MDANSTKCLQLDWKKQNGVQTDLIESIRFELEGTQHCNEANNMKMTSSEMWTIETNWIGQEPKKPCEMQWAIKCKMREEWQEVEDGKHLIFFFF